MAIRIALSIAGSDSGGGAGIQADIKTIASLGVFPCTAITAITAQNTSSVNHIFPVPAISVRKQIETVLSDMSVDAIKIGMVYDKQIISEISDLIENRGIPIVLDPILASGTGFKLFLEKFLETFKSRLIPISYIVTPNVTEAEKITQIRIKNESDMIESANKIIQFGAKNVIIKGGHLDRTRQVVDILVNEHGEITKLYNPRVNVNETHGSGCNFSAAITAFIAQQYSVSRSFLLANQHVQDSMLDLIKLGHGLVVDAPIFSIYDDAIKYRVVTELSKALNTLMLEQKFREFIPETHSNFVFALPHAKARTQVAGIDGRIVKIMNGFKQAGPVRFGGSSHVSSAVLVCMKFNPAMRSAINIKFNERLIECCKSLYTTTEYERSKEPMHVNEKEGMTIPWGIKQALLKDARSEIIFHTGGMGKEAMILIFGITPSEVVNKVKRIIKFY
ncbi:MAG TPA: bifunctional hydroxymethylpyrimidine kinase/phosphomethylpyrimidine kinase [Nitrososphaeraceae archaeon]|jgi:hydroxymethylpyrimidine/phosphomethylpyrimidine kinase